MLRIVSLTSAAPTYTQDYNIQKDKDGKFVKYISSSNGIYALTFPLAKLITFEDFNYADMYPMCVPCGDGSKQHMYSFIFSNFFSQYNSRHICSLPFG